MIRLAVPLLALALLGCTPVPTLVLPSPSSGAAAHDRQLDRVRAELESEHGLSFEVAGPHHLVGTDADGNQLDLVGVPVEQVVITVMADDPAEALRAARRYLPYARDLLHGPGPVWEWLDDAFACRAARESGCEARVERGKVSATFTDDGPDYWVVAITGG